MRNVSCEPLTGDIDAETTGVAMHRFAAELFPWHRSITGDGLRQTLLALEQRIPLEIKSVPSGTDVFGWTVPEEWKLRDAFVADEHGTRVIDFHESNLHVVNGSQPVDCWMTWDELVPHLHTLPAHPDWIPYRTAYFQNRWGFCLSHREFERLAALGNRSYHVRIDAEFFPGVLNYGELVLPGKSDREVLFSTHVCHPSLANDNLSSLVVMTELARRLSLWEDRPVTFRFLFIPATIGAITWLAMNQHSVDRIVGGLVLSNLGDAGGFTYKKSRRGNTMMDGIARAALEDSPTTWQLREYEPFGYDERQFCSPGFNLPMGRLCRTPHGEFPEYHTSADNLGLIQPQYLAESLSLLLHIAKRCQEPPSTPSQQQVPGPGKRFMGTHPFCEPPLGRYGLYQGYGWINDREFQESVMWLLNYSDGLHDLQQVSTKSKIAVPLLEQAATKLVECGLLR